MYVLNLPLGQHVLQQAPQLTLQAVTALTAHPLLIMASTNNVTEITKRCTCPSSLTQKNRPSEGIVLVTSTCFFSTKRGSNTAVLFTNAYCDYHRSLSGERVID